ncbi:MAG: helix-turn-helix transcriptional regulator [Treponema sp.]|nr:helix-turn-helix transcriptional regulator [Treponema sp.]
MIQHGISKYELEINKILVKNIETLMKQHEISQNEITKQLNERLSEKSISISQSTINRYMNEKVKMPLAVAYEVCDILSVSLSECLKPDMQPDMQRVMQNIQGESQNDILTVLRWILKDNKKFIFDTERSKDDFIFYEGIYHCYFHPTIASERDKPLTGKLTFSVDRGFCNSVLQINTGKPRDGSDSTEPFIKLYKGVSLISEPANSWYSILIGENIEEMVFLSFRYMKLNARFLDCRIAEVLTTAAGGKPYPVVLRMFLSREKIQEQHYNAISPHLFMNTSDIYIAKTKLHSIKNVDNTYKSVIDQLERYEYDTSPPEEIYMLDEAVVKETAKRFGLIDFDSNTLITLLRASSISMYHNKVSVKADDLIRNLLMGYGYYNRQVSNNSE